MHKHKSHHHHESHHKKPCACKKKTSGHRRKPNSAIMWISKKVRELRSDPKNKNKSFGWFGRKAGELYRKSHKKSHK